MSEAEKRAPVQRLSCRVPWGLHLRAYNAYSKRWGAQPAMIDLDGRDCRGGFSVEEMDEFVPGWRRELEEADGVNLVESKRLGEIYLTATPAAS
jgi:hypothetical protein